MAPKTTPAPIADGKLSIKTSIFPLAYIGTGQGWELKADMFSPEFNCNLGLYSQVAGRNGK
ncbi:MAG: hypothetical protein H7329_02855 [Opitutaceae bacterium]|nr:hypothetical protein [Cytophagales bacterium]